MTSSAEQVPPLSLTADRTPPALGNLPSLPFELQLAILSQVPPNQLFFLRRVSHAWNNMLQNPNLLEAINSTLPFLSSAPNLTSRMKRRMRMVRGEPVWVKSPFDVFPWALPYWKDDSDFYQWQRFSDGRFLVLSAIYRSPHHPDIKLTIGDIRSDGTIEVDVLAVMKQVNPVLHDEWTQDMNYISRFRFHVQGGMAVVGLKASKQNRVLGTYFFVFSVENQQLLKHVYIAQNHLQKKPPSIITQVTATHFLTIQPADNEIPAQNLLVNSSLTRAYRITIHPLIPNINSGFHSESTEILITDPENVLDALPYSHSSGFTIRVKPEHPVTQVALDHLGRIWLPYLNNSIITTTENIDAKNKNIARYLHIHQLPRSQCSRWVILDPPVVQTVLETMSTVASGGSISTDPSGYPRLRQSDAVLFGNYHSSLYMVDFYPQKPGDGYTAGEEVEDASRMVPGIPRHSHDSFRMNMGYRGRQIFRDPSSMVLDTTTIGPGSVRIFTQAGFPSGKSVEINLRIPDTVSRQCWKMGRDSQIETSAAWGYLTIDPYGQKTDPENVVNNVYLLPFHGNAGNRVGGWTWSEAENAGWQRASNGVPPKCLMRNKQCWEDRLVFMEIAWGDDGVICWWTDSSDWGIDRVWKWCLVCYEEDWQRPGITDVIQQI